MIQISAASFGSFPDWSRDVREVILGEAGANHGGQMRMRLCVCSLSLILVCGAAYAEPEEEPIGTPPQATLPQSGNAGALAAIRRSPTPAAQAPTPKAADANTPELIRKRGAEWLAQCLKDWDAATHMTRKDWQRVCRRVSDDRVNELIRQAKQ